MTDRIGNIEVSHSGGTVDVSRPEIKADTITGYSRHGKKIWLTLNPENARRLAAALIRQADQCDTPKTFVRKDFDDGDALPLDACIHCRCRPCRCATSSANL